MSVVLVGVSDWAGGHFDSWSAETVIAGPSIYEGSRTASLNPPPEPVEAGAHLLSGSTGYTFRRNVPEVRLQFTVADEQGRLVRNLSAEDVRIYDNRAEVPHFSAFEHDDNLALALGLILDTSDSVKRVLADEKAASVSFLERVMRPRSDTAFVMSFGGDVKLWQAATADRQQLMDAIGRLQQPGWGTRFYDALYSACAGQLAPKESGDTTHRALVVLSDGDDTASFRSLGDVVAIAQRSEIQIYALTIHPQQAADRGDRVLQRLADATGGRLYIASSSKELDSAFTQIEQDLRTQYYVSFPPQQSTPGYHELRVEVRGPRPFQVHARRGYYAME